MSETTSPPIVFVLGLSGVGKSTLGKLVAKELNCLHMEQDIPQGHGIDKLGLRNEWKNYLARKQPDGLAAAIRARVRRADRRGAIVTFDSTVAPSPEHLACAAAAGMTTVILYGSDEDCLAAYLERERRTGRNYDKLRWAFYNTYSSARFRQPAFAPYRVDAFTDQGRRSDADLVTAVRRRIKG